MATHVPRLIVLTGGSGVGKTTLIERLKSLGYHTVPEAAMQVISTLNGMLDDGHVGGPGRQLEWRTKHQAAFGDLVGAVATAQGLGAALSATLAGTIIVGAGYAVSFLTLAAIAAVGLALYAMAMPETKPKHPAPKAKGHAA